MFKRRLPECARKWYTRHPQELDFRFSHPALVGPGAPGFGLEASAAVLDRKAAVFLIPPRPLWRIRK